MSGQFPVTFSIEGIADTVKEAGKGKKLPPVHLWTPPLSGDIDIRIAKDGRWYHDGGEIRRAGLVRVFSTILKREGDEIFLVTPVEKWRITVEDVPFVAVDVEAQGEGETQVLRFVTNVGDVVDAGPDHAIRIEDEAGEPAPYVMVRAGLEARIDRKSFYRMVEHGVEAEVDGQRQYGVWSGGMFFPLIAAEALG
ncbi:MAG: DUF1285 domain-containing protein [Rhodobacteraceae bacterium]|nr:DUF1285 domain-containing protein [Paracoccaceae bacterium]MCW9043322.1 DUF1285 domain-containing protein [Pseudopelagicola sp.]